MIDRIPDKEPLKREIPDGLVPRPDGQRLPSISKEDLVEMAKKGWERIGVIVLVTNPDGEILTVTHGEGNPKVPSGTMGVLSETLIFDSAGAEQPIDGISRLFSEELGLSSEAIQNLNLKAPEHGAWEPITFPLSGGREALGLVIILHADDQDAGILISRESGFKPTSEIRLASFMRPEPLAVNSPLASIFRRGTPQILQGGLELLTSPDKTTRIELPAPKPKSLQSLEDLKDLLRP